MLLKAWSGLSLGVLCAASDVLSCPSDVWKVFFCVLNYRVSFIKCSVFVVNCLKSSPEYGVLLSYGVDDFKQCLSVHLFKMVFHLNVLLSYGLGFRK